MSAPRAEEPTSNFAAKNVRDLLRRGFGRSFTEKCKHPPHPQLRGFAAELEERYSEQVTATATSRFRDPADLASTLHHYYAMLTRQGVSANYHVRYIDLASDDAIDRFEDLIAKRNYDYFCVNDVGTSPDHAAQMDALVPQLLERYFSFPSPWNKAERARVRCDTADVGGVGRFAVTADPLRVFGHDPKARSSGPGGGHPPGEVRGPRWNPPTRSMIGSIVTVTGPIEGRPCTPDRMDMPPCPVGASRIGQRTFALSKRTRLTSSNVAAWIGSSSSRQAGSRSAATV